MSRTSTHGPGYNLESSGVLWCHKVILGRNQRWMCEMSLGTGSLGGLHIGHEYEKGIDASEAGI